MFTRIKFTRSLRNALRYNEVKIKEGTAKCLHAENYLKEHFDMSLHEKLDRLVRRASLNLRTRWHGLHISINFNPGEDLSDGLMIELTKKYMAGIGFGDQPYLIYRHYDTAHPHVHVISIKIKDDGSQIFTGPRFYQHSKKVTEALEDSYNLVHYKKASILEESIYKVDHAQKVVRGKRSLMRSISDVLYTVIPNYKYTNLNELNAILRLYNVKVNPTKFTTNRGLLYFALNDQGKQDGRALKASNFLLKPTIDHLEKRFILNEPLREEGRKLIKQEIDWAFFGSLPDWSGFQEALRRERIAVVLQKEQQTGEQAIYFVDHRTKTVITGHDLGSTYSLKAIRERCRPDQDQSLTETQTQRLRLRPMI